jgi:RNA polymerase sigma-70 factor (ECF subfamily)
VGHPGGEALGEKALVRAARAGDRGAVERLFTGHETALLALCYGALGRVDDAEDAVQEVLYRALKALPRFRGDASVRTWLIRIAVNVCMDEREKRGRTAAYDEASEGWRGGRRSAEDAAVGRLCVAEALMQLSPRQRMFLLLKEREGLSPAEIAGVMGCSRRRVYYELTRAHDALVEWRARLTLEGS